MRRAAVTATLILTAAAGTASADIIYATGYRSGIYAVDLDAGTVTRVSTDRNAWSIAGSDDPTKLYLARSNGSLRMLDVETGNITGIGGTFTNNAMTFGLDGNLYAGAWGNGYLYRVDPGTGSATLVGDTGLPGFEGDLAPAADGSLYGLTTDNRIVSIDTITGASTTLADLTGTVDAWGIAATFDGRFWVSSASSLYRYDLSTGSLTFALDLGFNAYDLASTPGMTYESYGAIPTPAGAALLGAGSLFAFRRRKA
ncbi:MAG: hypothetical protein ACF8Q5_08265 [Phycisphaerales bacterium JB040]